MPRRNAPRTGSPTESLAPPSAVNSLPPAQRLLRLADVLDEASLRDGWQRPPLLVRMIERTGQPPELGVRSLDGDHPLAALMGFRAPADWSIIGTIVGGNMHPVGAHQDRSTSPPLTVRRDPEAQPSRARVIHLVHRSGHAVSTVRPESGEVHVDRCRPTDVSRGRIDDACRRALGLATSPPADPPMAVWAGIWLDRVMAAALDNPKSVPASWPDLAALHPMAPKLLARRASRFLDRSDIDTATTRLGRAWSWEQLRLACAGKTWAVESVRPEWAAWMDDGMFSRCVLQQLPDAADAIECVRAHLPEGLADELVRMIEHWGLAR